MRHCSLYNECDLYQDIIDIRSTYIMSVEFPMSSYGHIPLIMANTKRCHRLPDYVKVALRDRSGTLPTIMAKGDQVVIVQRQQGQHILVFHDNKPNRSQSMSATTKAPIRLENVEIRGRPRRRYSPELQRLLDAMPILHHDAGSNDIRCLVCLSDFVHGQRVKVLPCLHRFCPGCIDNWLATRRSCPVCRTTIAINI